MADEDDEAPEIAVAKLFRLAGHEVAQLAGAEPGTVDWFATPREGFVRPRTYWHVWRRCPERLDEALAGLERARVALHADRALGVAMEGGLPEGYAAESDAVTRVVSYRRLALDTGGISTRVMDHAASYAARGEPARYLTRGVESSLEEWVQHGNEDLGLWGASWSEHLAVIDHVAYEVALDFTKDPERVIPLVRIEGRLADLAEVPVAFAEGFAVPVLQSIDDLGRCARGLLVDVEMGGERWEGPSFQVHRASAEDMERWFRGQLSDPDAQGRLARVRRDVAAFRALSDAWPNAHRLLHAMTSSNVAPDGGDADWLVRVVLAYVQRVLADAQPHHQAATALADGIKDLEDGALEELALGGSAHSWAGWEVGSTVTDLWDVISSWVSVIDVGRKHRYATNRLIRDCLIALRIERELAAGRRELLARYDLPEEYVLLFLAALSPEAAAQAASGRHAEIRAQIEAEVERRLQLTLAHMLKRSAGAVRSHVKTIRRHVERGGDTDPEIARAFVRVEEESAFQCALAEQTRRLYEVPESDIEGVFVGAAAAAIAADLREAYPRVAFESAIEKALCVRASRDILREILHILLENAFQAVASADGLAAPRVRLEARSEGATIRVDVLDNGPGIAPGDREHIFDLYHSTKKGGDGRPLGTGMGLPIAQRYAKRVGAQIGLDPGRRQTCFFARFVAWRDIG